MDLESGTVCDVPQTTGRVIQPFQTVAEDVFIRAVGPQRSVNLFICAFEMLLLAYFLLSSACVKKLVQYGNRQLIFPYSMHIGLQPVVFPLLRNGSYVAVLARLQWLRITRCVGCVRKIHELFVPDF